MRNLLCCAVPFVIASLSSGLSSASTDTATNDKLLAIAKQYLQDRASRITEQPKPFESAARAPALTSASVTNDFASLTAAELPELNRLRATWKNTPVEYANAHAEVQDPVFNVGGNQAEVFLYEKTTLYFSHPLTAQGAPAATSYRLGHTLTFKSDGNQWSLSSDVLDLPQSALDPIPYFGSPRSSRKQDAPRSASPRPAVPLPALVPATSTPGVSIPQPKSQGPVANAAPYSRNDMVNYAVQWALGRNSRYADYGNDCTNFMSQALSAGGWDYVDSPHSDDPTAWWYDDGLRFNTNTWSVAHDLMVFAYWYSNPHRMYGYAGPLPRIADIVWADWDDANGNPGTDGHMDHAMMLTAFNPMNGNDWNFMYVSYHTTDTLNSPMAVVEQKASARGPHAFYFLGHNDTP